MLCNRTAGQIIIGGKLCNIIENTWYIMTLDSGIWRDKTIADKLMYIPNDDTQNYFICRLWLVFLTFGHSTKWTNLTNE